ncbi:MAG: tetratricopeptide repeat protein [Pirellulales bacterium]|nr:tetratricopeptide repeat protein [Pirellulales bacterium]
MTERSARGNRNRKTNRDQKAERRTSSPKRFIIPLVVVLLIIVAAGFWFFRSLQRPAIEVRGVVLISIDTCRADHLSCYGYDLQTTPNIDALASESVLFENVVSPVPLTLPAHSTMLTGTTPLFHGVHDNKGYQLGPSNVTLAEILGRNGFCTGAVISAFVLDSQFGLDQGFDSYSDSFDKTFKTAVGISERKGGEVSRHAVIWLDEHHRAPFFLFLHYYDPHANYEPPEPFASKFAASPYAGEIAYADHCIGQVIKKLKDLGVYENTLVIITADHGEMLGEHGEKTHAYFIYQGALKVPLIIKPTGRNGPKRIKELVGLTDIFPTVCGFLGMDPPAQMQGRDLSASLLGNELPPGDAKLYCESFLPTKYNACSLLGVVTDRWKYIQTTRPELYDLIEDPDESTNVVGKYPQEAQGLNAVLQDFLKEQGSHGTAETGLELDAEARRRLESLGYIGGGTSIKPDNTNDFGFDPNKDDPKDVIAFHNMDVAMNMWLNLKDFEKADKLCKKILSERPNHPNLDAALGEIAIAKNDMSGAILHLRKAIELGCEKSKVHSQLGYALVKEGKIDEAIKHCEIALQLGSEEAITHQSLGVAFYRQGKYQDAVKHFKQALALTAATGESGISIVEIGEAHKNLGNALLKLGQNEEAELHFKKAAELGQESSGTAEREGMELLRQGKTEEAIAHFKKTLEAEPANAGLHVNLGAVLARNGKLDEAIEYFKKAVAIDPKMAKAHGNLANALLEKNELDGAIDHFQKALEIQPDQPLLLNGLGIAHARRKDLDKAVDCWNRALQLKPDWPVLLNSLAWLKATHEDPRFRDAQQSIRLARRACELTKFEQPVPMATLAAAYAAGGKFDESVDIAKKVLAMARSTKQEKLIAEHQRRLELYKAHNPFQAPSSSQDATKNSAKK